MNKFDAARALLEVKKELIRHADTVRRIGEGAHADGYGRDLVHDLALLAQSISGEGRPIDRIAAQIRAGPREAPAVEVE